MIGLGLVTRLKAAGVLGINKRNLDFTLAHNPRKLYPLVDDKLQTKKLAGEAGIPVPPLYAVISIQRQVRQFTELVAGHDDFVIKPAHGSGGNGIVVIDRRSGDRYRKISGDLLEEQDLQHHISNVLSGMYSLGGQSDTALIEYRVKFDPVFGAIAFQGVPDIRIIVFFGVPVMAMVRLPTKQSDGKANLHQGALGAGIDMATGITLGAVHGNSLVTHHPDTGNPVSGVQVPSWDTLLETAARCYELTGLGYIGADFVLDHDKGPLMLELNARPGLNIQIANHAGLDARLRIVRKRAASQLAPAERVDFAKQHFAAAGNTG